jgi:hypothetical protein
MKNGSTSLLRSSRHDGADHPLYCSHDESSLTAQTCCADTWRNHIYYHIGLVDWILIGQGTDGIHLDELGESISGSDSQIYTLRNFDMVGKSYR